METLLQFISIMLVCGMSLLPFGACLFGAAEDSVKRTYGKSTCHPFVFSSATAFWGMMGLPSILLFWHFMLLPVSGVAAVENIVCFAMAAALIGWFAATFAVRPIILLYYPGTTFHSKWTREIKKLGPRRDFRWDWVVALL